MIDVNTTNDLGETAIFSAVIHKNMDTVDVLIEHGCDINSVWQLSTPIYLMLCNKDIEACHKVLTKGALITTLSGMFFFIVLRLSKTIVNYKWGLVY